MGQAASGGFCGLPTEHLATPALFLSLLPPAPPPFLLYLLWVCNPCLGRAAPYSFQQHCTCTYLHLCTRRTAHTTALRTYAHLFCIHAHAHAHTPARAVAAARTHHARRLPPARTRLPHRVLYTCCTAIHHHTHSPHRHFVTPALLNCLSLPHWFLPPLPAPRAPCAAPLP